MSQVVVEERRIEGDVESIIDQDRVINFSDAVFAFAATLLVLKIDLPTLAPANVEAQLLHSMGHLWPQYLANIISFLIIGYYWLSHHTLFGLVRKFNKEIVWLNILFLITLSFLPFPVDLYGDFYMVPTVVVFYSASLAVVGFMMAIIWLYASHHHKLIDPSLSSEKIRFFTAKLLVAPLVFACSIPLVFFHPLLAPLSWLLIIVIVSLVNRHYRYTKVSVKNDLGI